MSDTPIYLFDSECVLCSRAVDYCLKHDTKNEIRFVAIKSQQGRKIALDHDQDPDDPDTLLYFENGHLYRHSDAVYALIQHVGGPARFMLWTQIFPRPFRDWAYSLIANNRYRLFGKMDHCLVPDAKTRARFVLPE